jgi:hypothetical protein
MPIEHDGSQHATCTNEPKLATAGHLRYRKLQEHRLLWSSLEQPGPPPLQTLKLDPGSHDVAPHLLAGVDVEAQVAVVHGRARAMLFSDPCDLLQCRQNAQAQEPEVWVPHKVLGR